MAQETTYAGKLGGLTRLSTALAANATDLTHLEGPRGRLDKILTEAVEVAKQQAALTAGKQEKTKRLQTLITDGERVAEGIRKFLKEHYGLRAEKLAEYGLQPFRGRSRKVSPQKPPETPDSTKPTPIPVSPAESK
jgi:hypothetical protein